MANLYAARFSDAQDDIGGADANMQGAVKTGTADDFDFLADAETQRGKPLEQGFISIYTADHRMGARLQL
ncbi:hypothetical protein MPQ_0951 [Methylovorus sp. MP688]|nr:hypothetical protein MPQ_0951 [Methylovorus sp. MP688]